MEHVKAPSVLSAGTAIRALLSESADVTAITGNIFPVVSDDAQLPYIAYRRTSLRQQPQKYGLGADVAVVEVGCFSESYAESVAMAEAVRLALDASVTRKAAGVRVRSCLLTDASESWSDDAYIQTLTFAVRI